jgi:hypothetical protein
MRFRTILLGPSVANCPTMREAFQLGFPNRNTRGNCGVLRPVLSLRCQSCEGSVVWDVMGRMRDGSGFSPCVSPLQSPLMPGHCFGEYPYCALRHGVVLLSRCPPEQV